MLLYCNLLTWLAAFADHEKRSGLVNVELKTKIRSLRSRKKIYGLTSPKMLPPPL